MAQAIEEKDERLKSHASAVVAGVDAEDGHQVGAQTVSFREHLLNPGSPLVRVVRSQ